MKTISVITINFNNCKGLEKTIQSVISQTCRDFEFIIIDGGSTDESVELIKKYQDKITYWISEKDQGIYHAQNKGIKAGSGKFLLFLNSGDYLASPTILKEVSEQLNDKDILYGDIFMEQANGNLIHEASPDVMTEEYLMVSSIWHPGAFIQKKLFDTYGYYDEKFKIASDYAFFVRSVLVNKVTTQHIQLTIAVFERGGISLNPDHFNLMVKERKQIQAMYFTKEQLKKMEQIEIRSIGRSSRIFRFVPDIKGVKSIYDLFYKLWYSLKMK